tara:strand:+ start:125 stop:661 length:537 start_codon:yes stop_codon:yes gene_type:complete
MLISKKNKIKEKNKISIKIKTERIFIERLKKKDINQSYVDRLNDKQLMKYSRHKKQKHTLKSSMDYFEKFDFSDDLYLSIKEIKTKKLIGTMTTYFKKNFSFADIGILISSNSHLGKNYGNEAWISLMSFLNKKINVKNITGGCHFNNIKMIKIFKNSGMSYSHKNLKKRVFYIKNFR